jgi:hypothetical protein
MIPQKVLIAAKPTYLETLIDNNGDSIERASLSEEVIKDSHNQQYNLVDKITASLEEQGIDYVFCPKRSYQPEDFQQSDLIISLGGDGQLLDVARYAIGKLILPIKSSSHSKGYLTTTDKLSVEEKLMRVTEDDFNVMNRTMLKGSIMYQDQMITSYALNDIFVGDYNNGSSKNLLSFDGKWYKQRSSGIVVTTGTGSTGWWSNTLMKKGFFAHYGKPFNPEIRIGKFVIKDLITKDKDFPGKIRGGTFGENNGIMIKSDNISNAVVQFDGSQKHYQNSRAFDFNFGDFVKISLADHCTKTITFK